MTVHITADKTDFHEELCLFQNVVSLTDMLDYNFG